MRTTQRKTRERRDPRMARFVKYRRAVLPDLMDVDMGALIRDMGVNPPPCDPVRDMQALIALIEAEGQP